MIRLTAFTVAIAIATSTLVSAVGAKGQHKNYVVGTIVSASATTIVVKTKAGTNTLAVSPETKVFSGITSKAVKDLTAGDRVRIRPAARAGGQAIAAEIELRPGKLGKAR
jgi:hypothetical protein